MHILFRRDRNALDLLTRTRGRANLTLRELFLEGAPEEETVNVRMSDVRIAERAQASFEFHEAVSARAFKRALVREFRRVCDETGIEYDYADEGPLRRAVELFVLTHPDALRDALKEAQARALVTEPADAVPPLVLTQGDHARPARLGACGVFPPKMNGNERRFAELLEADENGQVLWWLRLQENATWAANLVLLKGRRFFPDFAVGVSGRKTTDAIALLEIKDDDWDGRLHSDLNRIKIRSRHLAYQNVRWTWSEERHGWVKGGYNAHPEDIQVLRSFDVERLVLVE